MIEFDLSLEWGGKPLGTNYHEIYCFLPLLPRPGSSRHVFDSAFYAKHYGQGRYDIRTQYEPHSAIASVTVTIQLFSIAHFFQIVLVLAQ